MQTELPDGFAERMKPLGLAETYDGSGWCFVEKAISGGVKVGNQRLDLGLRTSESYYHLLTMQCAAKREPPLMPDKVLHLLETEKQFTAKADVGVVDKVYRTFFAGVSGYAKKLDFSKLKWGDEEVKHLVQVLPEFARLSTLE